LDKLTGPPGREHERRSSQETTKQVEPASADHSLNHVSLLFTWGDHAHALALREGQSLVVGRTETAELMIDDASLSRAHARLSICDGEVLVEDLASTNGCLLNGMRVTCAQLKEHDLLKLGAVEVRVCARATDGEAGCGVSHAAWMRALSEELTRARLGGRCVSVLALKHKSAERPRHVIQVALKPLDRVCTFAPSVELVLLPERDGAAARLWANTAISELNLACQIGIASYPVLVTNAETLVGQALDACHGAAPGAIEEAKPSLASGAQRALVLSVPMLRLHELDMEDLPFDIWRDEAEVAPDESSQRAAPRPLPASTEFQSLPDRVRAFEMALILDALEQADGNQAQAARILGVPRRTLASKVHAYGMLKAPV
jgi:hypothetical protein